MWPSLIDTTLNPWNPHSTELPFHKQIMSEFAFGFEQHRGDFDNSGIPPVFAPLTRVILAQASSKVAPDPKQYAFSTADP